MGSFARKKTYEGLALEKPKGAAIFPGQSRKIR
jgi:hypothetical protein